MRTVLLLNISRNLYIPVGMKPLSERDENCELGYNGEYKKEGGRNEATL